MRKLLLLLFTLIPAVVWAQRYDLSGRVLVKGTDKPIAQAVVELPQAGLWAVADGDGNFTVKGVPKGATVSWCRVWDMRPRKPNSTSAPAWGVSCSMRLRTI